MKSYKFWHQSCWFKASKEPSGDWLDIKKGLLKDAWFKKQNKKTLWNRTVQLQVLHSNYKVQIWLDTLRGPVQDPFRGLHTQFINAKTYSVLRTAVWNSSVIYGEKDGWKRARNVWFTLSSLCVGLSLRVTCFLLNFDNTSYRFPQFDIR